MKTLQFNSIKDISELEKIGVSVEFIAEDEEISPSDMYGDETENEEWINNIYRVYDLTPGFIHPEWFCAKVTVSVNRGVYKDEETDYLGCCSYKSFEEFTCTEGDYYEDMILTCIDGLNDRIIEHNNSIQKSWDIRRAKNLISKYGYYIVSQKELKTL